MSSFFNELKRRNVIKAAIAYAVVAWVLLQVLSIVLPSVDAPEWVMKTIILLLLISFPFWVFVSWVYEVTPEGLKKTENVNKDQSLTATTNKRLNVLILVGIVAAIAVTLFQPKAGYMSSTNTVKYSIAVLPFKNMSTDNENEWFCDGVTEDILTYLSKVSGLRVISRTSVMQYKNTDKTIPEIAKELGVSYLVEGSVRRQNNQVLITAQLIRANDEHMWSENYNENLNDVFKIQQEVAKKIVDQLKIHVSPDEEKALNTAVTTNLDAYELYLRGRGIADTRTKENLEKSIELYQEAIKLDPQFAEAYAEIANSYMLLHPYSNLDISEAIDKAKLYVDKALIINPNTVRAFTVLGSIFYYEENWDKAKENFEKAIAINPNDATAHHHFAIYYRDNPDHDIENLLKEINEAQRLDPLSYPINDVKLNALLQNNKIEEAQKHFMKTIFFYPAGRREDFEGLLNSLINKDLSELIYSYEHVLNEHPNNPDFHYTLSDYYNGIFNDKRMSLQHAKKAFELEPSSAAFARRYIYALYDNKQFEAAKKFLDEDVFLNLNDSIIKTIMLQDYYAYQGLNREALIYNEKLKAIDLDTYYFQKAWLYSRMGDAKSTYEILKNPNFHRDDGVKVMYFAGLKEIDSLYHYLDKISNYENPLIRIFRTRYVNGLSELDPYRNEPRYKEFLKKNYIPVDKQKN